MQILKQGALKNTPPKLKYILKRFWNVKLKNNENRNLYIRMRSLN